jgi:translation elongation factor P/translation initiation factor 5A
LRGSTTETVCKSDEKFDPITHERIALSYSYAVEFTYVFMDE